MYYVVSLYDSFCKYKLSYEFYIFKIKVIYYYYIKKKSK